jgi:hypothetical protein
VAPDLSDYGENPAWPLLLDNFEEWFKARRAQGGTQDVAT